MDLRDFRSDKLKQTILSTDKNYLMDEIFFMLRDALKLESPVETEYVIRTISGTASSMSFTGELSNALSSQIVSECNKALAEFAQSEKGKHMRKRGVTSYMEVLLSYYEQQGRKEIEISKAIETNFELGTILEARQFCERFLNSFSRDTMIKICIVLGYGNYREYLKMGMKESEAYRESCSIFLNLVREGIISNEQLDTIHKIYAQQIQKLMS